MAVTKVFLDACALKAKADNFLTGDKKLLLFQEIPVIII